MVTLEEDSMLSEIGTMNTAWCHFPEEYEVVSLLEAESRMVTAGGGALPYNRKKASFVQGH
jgi:hypothetical protein